MWNEQKIEKYLEKILKKEKELGKEVGKEYFADYLAARKYLVEEVLPFISIAEPTLTDHGATHVADVLKNAWYLLTYHDEIGKHKDIKRFTSLDLYVLCLSILFHDVGNINGRDNHNQKVWDIYQAVRGDNAKYYTERDLIISAAEAHCGKTKSGSRDTLKNIKRTSYSLSGDPINFLEIVSVLRFADELAEGPQRTSDYLLRTDIITPESELYHKYAKITDVFIDRGNGRIVLTYGIDIKSETPDSLKKLLTFVYERIIKLDEERKYTKFYSEFLVPFKKTEVLFKFSNKGKPLDISIGDITLNDTYIVPGEKKPNAIDLIERFKELNIDNILNQMNFN